jgi:hypothetical protein
MTDTPAERHARAPWYRSPWPMLILAGAAATALVVGLAVRFLADTGPGEVVDDLRHFALIFGAAAFFLSELATTTKPQQVPSLGRGLWLRLLPRLDEVPPPATPTAARWTPVSRRLATFAWVGAALWYVVAFVGWLISRAL